MQPNHAADRAAAHEWAKELIASDDWIILDTETTGLGPKDQVVEIAIIDHLGHPLLDQRIKPTIPIPPAATAVHGLDDAALADKPTFADIAPVIQALLHDKTIICYNLDFDFRLLIQTAAATNTDPLTPAAWCAMQQYSRYCGDWSDYHGNYRYQRLPRQPGHHSAISDCRQTLALIQRMAANP